MPSSNSLPQFSRQSIKEVLPENDLQYASYALKSDDKILWVHKNSKAHFSTFYVLGLIFMIGVFCSIYFVQFINSFTNEPVEIHLPRGGEMFVSPLTAKVYNGTHLAVVFFVTYFVYIEALKTKTHGFIFTDKNIIKITPSNLSKYIFINWADVEDIEYGYGEENDVLKIFTRRYKKRGASLYLTGITDIHQLSAALPVPIKNLPGDTPSNSPIDPPE